MTQSVLSDSYVGYSEELAIFEKPLQNVGVKRAHTVTFYPINDYSNQGVIQFSVPNNGASYLDLRSVRLNVTCKITGKNNEPVESPVTLIERAAEKEDNREGVTEGAAEGATQGGEESKEETTTATKKAEKLLGIVGVTNNFMHSMFGRVDVALQNKVLTHSDQAYSYLAYLKALLYTNEEVKNSSLQTAMFYKDTEGELDDCNWALGDNAVLKTRSILFDKSKEVDMCGRLYCDILEINRYIPNGVPLNLTLYPNTPDFCLLSPLTNGSPYKVVITKASLDVTMIDVDPLISVAHSELLQTRPAVFPYIRTEVKKFTLAKGVFSGEINDPFNGRVPSEMVCGLVSDSANHGKLWENPFMFDHMHLNFIQVTVDGQDLSQGPLQPRYALDSEGLNSLYLDAYKTLDGISGEEGVIPVSRSEYPKGYCLYRFFAEPTCTGSSDDLIPLKRTGNMRVSVKFDRQLPKPTTMVIFAKFPAALKIDKNRAVYEV